MTANQIPEAAVDALYDELFRVGKYLHAPVPIDPKEIIRRHFAAAQQQGRATPPSAPGSRAWMAEVCRAAALSLAAHGVRNDQLSKVADWIAQQPAAVDGACAVAAIQFALSNPEGMTFLRLWNEGEFDTLRREWPDAPSEVYVGADPLATKHQEPTT